MNKEEAIRKVKGCLTDYFPMEDYGEVEEIIEALRQESKIGKIGQWIFVDKTHEHARCSECGYGNVDLLDGKPHNYCPNCGSFMMEDEKALEYTDQDVLMSAT